MGVLAFGFLMLATAMRTDNMTQTGESMIVAENGETREAVMPIAEVATIKYDVFSERMTPPTLMANVEKKELVLSTTAPIADGMVEGAKRTFDNVGDPEPSIKANTAEVVTKSNPEETKNVKEETKNIESDKEVVKKSIKSEVDPDELYMLSHLIYAEAGSSTCSDTTRYYVGSVVLNRVKNDWFKEDTIEEVIFADGQYACTWLGTYYNEPTERCVEIARDLLENGSVLPENVVFQAEFKQGDGVYDYMDNTYFCYKNDKQ